MRLPNRLHLVVVLALFLAALASPAVASAAVDARVNDVSLQGSPVVEGDAVEVSALLQSVDADPVAGAEVTIELSGARIDTVVLPYHSASEFDCDATTATLLTCTQTGALQPTGSGIDVWVVAESASFDATATITAPGDVDGGNDLVTETFAASEEYDLDVTGSSAPTTWQVGDTEAVRASVTNGDVSPSPAGRTVQVVVYGASAAVSIARNRPGTDTCSTTSATPLTVTCTLGSIAQDEVVTIDVAVLVTDQVMGADITLSSDLSDTGAGNEAATFAWIVVADEAEATWSDGVPVPRLESGVSGTFSSYLHNDGPGRADGVVVTATLPAGIAATAARWTVDSGAHWTTCTVADPQHVSCVGGSLPTGVSGELQVTALSASDAGYVVALHATSGGEFAPVDGTRTVLVEPAHSDLTLQGVVQSPAAVGSSGQTLFIVGNTGPDSASDVQIGGELPANVTIDSVTIDDFATTTTCPKTATQFTCPTISSLGAGEGRLVTVDWTASSVGSGLVRAWVTQVGSADFDPSDNELLGVLETTPASGAGTVDLESSVHFASAAGIQFDVFNWGPSGASGVVATYRMPAGLHLDASLGDGTCTAAGQLVTCALDPVPAMSGATVQLDLGGAVQGSGSYVHVVHASATEEDVNPGNDSATWTADAVARTRPFAAFMTDMAVTTNTGGHVRVGDTATITVDVDAGPSGLRDPAVRVVLPAGVLRLQHQSFGQDSSGHALDPTCSFDAPVLTCSYADAIAAGDHVYLDVTVGALTAGRKEFDVLGINGGIEANPDDNDALGVLDVWAPSDVDASVVASASAAVASVGSPVTYSVDTAIDGTPAAPAQLHVDVDPALDVSDVRPSSCTVVAHAIDCAAPATLEIDATATSAGTHGVRASVSIPDADRDPSNDESEATVDFSGSSVGTSGADLSVDVATQYPYAVTGDAVPVAVRVLGDTSPLQPTTGIEVAIPVPAGTTFEPNGSTGSCALDGAVVRCAVGRGRGAIDRTLLVRFHLLTAGSRTFTATVAATVLGGGPDVDASNDSASATVVASDDPHADLSVAVADLTPDAGVSSPGGDDATWTFVVGVDDGVATDARLALTIPAGATVLAVRSSVGSCDQVGGAVTCDLGDVREPTCSCAAPHVELTLHLPGPGEWTVDASATTSAMDDDPVNDEVSSTLRLADPDLVDVAALIDAPDAVTAGSTTRLVARARNAGPTAVPGSLVLTIPVAATVRSIAASPTDSASCVRTGSTITCAFEYSVRVIVTLDAPASASTLGFDATASASATDSDPTNDSAHAETDVNVASDADLRASLQASPASATTGEPVTWTSTVLDRGPAAARGLTWQLQVPADWTGVAITDAGGGACSVAAQLASCTRSALASGAVWTVRVTGTPGAVGTSVAVASVHSTSTDPAAANDAASVALVVGAPAAGSTDLATTITDAADPFLRGSGALRYVVRVANGGAVVAKGVAVDIELPASGAVFSAALPSRGTCAAPVANVVHCALGGVPAGGAATIAIDVVPTSLGVTGIHATASSTTTDPVAANDEATEQTTVVEPGTADVRTAVTPSASTVAPGATVTYAVTVTNDGLVAANGSVLQASLGSGLALTGATVTSPVAACSTPSGNAVACPLGAIAPGASATVSVTATATTAGSAVSTFSASTTAVDSVPSNDAATTTTTIATPATTTPPVDDPPAKKEDTPAPTPPVDPGPAPDTTAPTATIKSVTCSGKPAARTCTLRVVTGDAVSVTRVQASVYRQLPKAKCLSWTGRKWLKTTCAKARATWVVITTKAGPASKALPKVGSGQLIVRLRASDAAGNQSQAAQRVARA